MSTQKQKFENNLTNSKTQKQIWKQKNKIENKLAFLKTQKQYIKNHHIQQILIMQCEIFKPV